MKCRQTLENGLITTGTVSKASARGFESPTPSTQGLDSRGVNDLARFVWSGIRQYLCGVLTPSPHSELSTHKPTVDTILGRVLKVRCYID
jgi:hypothetical protein